MKTLKSHRAVILIVVWILLGVFLVSTNWLWDWNVIQSFATWVLAAGVFLAVLQQIERQNEIKREKIKYTENKTSFLSNQKSASILKYMYANRPRKIDDVNRVEQGRLKEFLNLMNEIGILLENGDIDREYTIKSHRGKYIRCWFVLKTLICKERLKTGKYGEGIEFFAKEAYKYQIANLNKKDWVKLDGQLCEFDVNSTC